MVVKIEKHVKSIENYLEFGWYQVFHYFCIQWMILTEVADMEYMVFGGAPPGGVCQNTTQHLDEKELCRAMKNQSCNGLLKPEFKSIPVQWNLICDEIGFVFLITSLQMAGVLIGAPTFGQISDLFGRKKTFIGSSIALISVGTASGFSPSWQVMAAFRFFIGFFIGGVLTTAYVFLVEFLQIKYRSAATAMGGWNVGYIVFPLIAYLTGDWKHLTIVANLISVPCIAFLFFTKESPRWLVQKGRIEEAEEVLRSIAKWNRRPLDPEEDVESVLQRASSTVKGQKAKKHSFWHLFYTPNLTRNTGVMVLTWFTVSITNYGILFNIGNLAGSIYLNVFLFGLLRWFAGILACLLEINIQRCGRKVINGVACGVIAVACFTAVVLLTTGLTSSAPVRGLMLASAFMTSPLWLVVYLLSAELYPTPIRNLANSFGSAFARLGGVVAPQVLFLATIWSPAPYLVFGSLAAIDLVVFQLLLPETKGKPLPEKMPDKSEKSGSACFSTNGSSASGSNAQLSSFKDQSRNQSTDTDEQNL